MGVTCVAFSPIKSWAGTFFFEISILLIVNPEDTNRSNGFISPVNWGHHIYEILNLYENEAEKGMAAWDNHKRQAARYTDEQLKFN